VDKLVALESSIESFKDKIRFFNPGAPMIGLNSKKYDEEEPTDSSSALNDAMIQDDDEEEEESEDSDEGLDAMDVLEEISSDSIPVRT
jgi:predicted HTH transcriptional regulator